MSSPREHLARVSYFPGVRPPYDEEARPAGSDDGWHVEGSDEYLDESADSAAAPADPVEVVEEQGFEPERLSPRHPAGKGRASAARPTLTVVPTHDSVGSGEGVAGGEENEGGERYESDSARADRERSADPRLAPAMERMSRLLATVEPDSPERPTGRKRTPSTVAFDDDAPADGVDAPDDEALAARAERVSMHALTRRGVSTSELRRTLTSRELPEHIVEAELDRLARVGLLDDAELARTLVRTLTERKRLGRSALVGELRRRGLDSEVIDLALDDLDGDDEVTRADELALKRAPQLRSLDPVTAERRLLGFLQRKGYSGSIAQTAVRKALRESPSGVRFE